MMLPHLTQGFSIEDRAFVLGMPGSFHEKTRLFLFERRPNTAIIMLTHLTTGFSIEDRALFTDYRALFMKDRALSLRAPTKHSDNNAYTLNSGLFHRRQGFFRGLQGSFHER